MVISGQDESATGLVVNNSRVVAKAAVGRNHRLIEVGESGARDGVSCFVVDNNFVVNHGDQIIRPGGDLRIGWNRIGWTRKAQSYE